MEMFLMIALLILLIHLNIITYIFVKYIEKQQGTNSTEPINNKNTRRKHSRIAQTSFSNPLNPYEHFKNKDGLYEPKPQGGGVKLKPFEEE